jgi:hypothetical protein
MKPLKRSRARTVLLSLVLLGGAAVLAGQVAPGCADTGSECDINYDFNGCKGPLLQTAGGGGMGGGGGTTTSTGTMGGGGSDGGDGGECADAGSCPMPCGQCASVGMPTCINGKCGLTYMAGDAGSQNYGSCKTNVCDATGTVMVINDDTNFLDDGNPCTAKICVNGVLMTSPMLGAACMTSGFCELNPDPASSNGSVVCAECKPGDPMACSALPGYTCVKGTCVPGHCTNSMFEPALHETDVDCGGGMKSGCLPCVAGMACSLPSDCFSQVCDSVTHKCQAPACNDHIKNGTETGVDCGGGTCSKCPDGAMCLQPGDCLSGVCMPPMMGAPPVCQAATCFDGVKNGVEDGVDCRTDGGSDCPPCCMQ